METLVERDQKLEQLWEQLSDIPMNPETEEMEEAFLHFPAGTHREEIWKWFDARHSKGVAYLLGFTNGEYSLELRNLFRRRFLCNACQSETCIFNPEGVCLYPLVFGEEAVRTDRGGCFGYVDKEELYAR